MTALAPESVRIAAETVTRGDGYALLRDYFRELGAVLDQPEIDVGGALDLVPPDGRFLVLRVGGAAVGCVGVRLLSPGMVEVKRLYLAPDARKLGLAERVLAAAEATARELTDAPDAQLVLDTDPRLLAARRLYERYGFAEVPPYNDNPRAGMWFAKALR